jgi:hypothetical protein
MRKNLFLNNMPPSREIRWHGSLLITKTEQPDDRPSFEAWTKKFMPQIYNNQKIKN